MPEVVHVNQRQFAISRTPQTDFVTPKVAVTTDPKAYEYWLVNDNNFTDYSLDTKTNEGASNGQDFPSESWLLKHDTSRPINMHLGSDPIGRVFYGLFGADAITQPDSVGVASAYQHYFTPQDANTSRQLPAWTLIEKAAGAVNDKFPSMVFESLEISGDGSCDRISAAVTLKGSGRVIRPSAINFSGGSNHVVVPTGVQYFLMSQIALVRSDRSTQSNATSYGVLIEEWRIKWSNEFLGDAGYRPGAALFQTSGDPASGAIRSELLFGKRMAEMEFTVRLRSDSTEYTDIVSQREMDVLFTLTGPTIGAAVKHSLITRFYKATFKTIGKADHDGIITVKVTCNPLYDVAQGKNYDVTLVNTTASYVA